MRAQWTRLRAPHRVFPGATALVLTALTAGRPATAQSPTEIGPVPGEGQFAATTISGDGSTVGGSCTGSGFSRHAALWRATTGPFDIGELSGGSAGVHALSANGS